MQDLATKMTGQQLTAAEWNEVPEEVQNVITTSGLSLSGGDLSQLVKSVMQYVGSGSFYIDSGAADAYVLSPITGFSNPHSLSDGLTVQFIASAVNTGASTVNVAGLGVKDIVDESGAALTGGEINNAALNTIYYRSGTDDFRLIIPNIPDATETVKGIAEIATQAETDTGTDDTRFITPLKLATKPGSSNIQAFSKAADEDVTNSTTLQDDDDLNNVISLAANSKYILDGYLFVAQTGTAGGIKTNYVLPAGATLTVSTRVPLPSKAVKSKDTSNTGSVLISYVDTTDIGNAGEGIYVRGIITTAGTAGNLGFQWAQESADIVETTLAKDSWLRAEKIA